MQRQMQQMQMQEQRWMQNKDMVELGYMLLDWV